MLSIGGYDVIKLIEARWLRRVGLSDGEPNPGSAARDIPPPPD
jgi:hypothetical protein